MTTNQAVIHEFAAELAAQKTKEEEKTIRQAELRAAKPQWFSGTKQARELALGDFVIIKERPCFLIDKSVSKALVTATHRATGHRVT